MINWFEKINSDFLKDLSEISNTKNIKLTHLSTDSVFDGTKEMPYVETDTPNPMTSYGMIKFLTYFLFET